MHIVEKKRVGVYGFASEENKILVIVQKKGPFTGCYDFPGGGIERGENDEEALRREFLEEVAMSFRSMHFLSKLEAVTHIESSEETESMNFHQIGLIYQVDGLQKGEDQLGEYLEYFWCKKECFTKGNTSPLLWKFLCEVRSCL